MKLSIITISYNAVEEIERTLASVYSQTFKDFEHIIIDGSSNDGTVDIINQYVQKNTIFVSEKDSGIYNAMNKGILLSRGEYLLFLNAGDVLIGENILKEISEYLQHYEIIVYKCNYMNNLGKIVRVLGKGLKLPYHLEIGSLPHPSTFIKRSVFEEYGLYDESFVISGDYDFFSRVLYGQATTFLM